MESLERKPKSRNPGVRGLRQLTDSAEKDSPPADETAQTLPKRNKGKAAQRMDMQTHRIQNKSSDKELTETPSKDMVRLIERR